MPPVRPVTEFSAQWCDLFIMVDDGLVTLDEYRLVETAIDAQRARHPGGLGGLVIIPEGSSPPPDKVREYLRRLLDRVGLRALAYVVEGSGFKAATTRAVLVGLGLFQRKAYPTHVTTTIANAVAWLDSKMPPSAQRKNALAEVRRVLAPLAKR